MSSDTVPPVTETDHENSWSANLERDHHAESQALVIEQAIEAVERTAPGSLDTARESRRSRRE